MTLNKAAFYPTVVDRENNTRYLLDVEELQQLTKKATLRGLFEPLNLFANYIMNGTETIVSSGIILDVSGFQALSEEGEVSAANITTSITITNTTDSNAAAVMTIPFLLWRQYRKIQPQQLRERRNKKNNYNISKLVHIFLSLQSNKR